MSELFQNRDMNHVVFDTANLEKATFHNVNLNHARFDDVNLLNASINNANLSGFTIEDADITGMTIFGFRIDQLISAEQDRLDPERARLRMEDKYDPECVREVMARLNQVRENFSTLLRTTPLEFLKSKPGEKEWSIIEILRHLVFAEDMYIHRWILRDSEPWCEAGLLPAFLADNPAFAGFSSYSEADLEMILSAWYKIHKSTDGFLKNMTREALQQSTRDVDFGQGTVGQVLQVLASHDLMHMRCAERWIREQLDKIQGPN